MAAANLFTVGAPHAVAAQANAPGFTLVQVDAGNEGVASVFQAPDAITITHLGFRYGARTGTPPTYRISLQSPAAATGFPDGTILGGGTPASATFTPPADTTWDGTWQWVALDNSYLTTRGQQLCSVIDYSAGTIDASNRSSFTTIIASDSVAQEVSTHPYSATLAGTWAKVNGWPVYGVRTASSRYGFPVENYYTTNTAATNGRRQAMAFTLPAGMGSTLQVAGLKGHLLCAAAGQAFKIGLWNAAGTELASGTFDGDVLSASPLNPRLTQWLFTDATLPTLNFGTKYYAGIEVTSATAVGLRGWQLDSADDLAAFHGGSIFHHATWDGASWTDDLTVRPVAELILADWTASGGGGGGLIGTPSKRAGMQ